MTPSPGSGGRLAAVTGAAGFIGSHVVEQFLARGWRVRALVHYNALGSIGNLGDLEPSTNLEVVFGDVTDEGSVRSFVEGAACVVHLAALVGIPYSYSAPRSYLQVNAGGTFNVLEACRGAQVPRLVHVSTSETLGTARSVPQDEGHPLQAQSPYAATKIAADKLAESYALSFALPVVVLRPFNTYGPRQSARAVIPSIIAQALSPACGEIRLGALDTVRDLTYATDTAAAMAEAAEAPLDVVRGRLFHLGCGQGVSIGEVAGMVQRMAGTSKPVVTEARRLRPAASEVQRLVSDNSLIRREVGWEPRVPLEEGLSRTIEWIRPRLDRFAPDDYAR